MLDLGKQNVLGVRIDAVDYDAAVSRILAAAHEREPFAVSALAVHGVMTGATDAEHRHRLNRLDLVVPDGQPVRWALGWLHGAKLAERVYGPELTWRVCQQAAREQVPIFLYGSRAEVLDGFAKRLTTAFPKLRIAGKQPSRFRQLTAGERDETARMIRDSGAGIVLLGLGCPRQEVWAYEMRELLPMPVLAVGAAFDFHAGTLPQAPPWMQRRGLEWAFRLYQEPRRLWHRYLVLGPAYLSRVALQVLKLRRYDPADTVPPREERRYG